MLMLHDDLQNFQSLYADWDAFVGLLAPRIGPIKALNLARHNLSIADYWKPVPVSVFQNEGTGSIADISIWRTGFLVMNAKAKAALAGLLADCGEFLPLVSEKGEYWLFNCLVVAEPGAATNSAVFKVLPDLGLGLIGSDAFRSAIERAGLKGLYFTADLQALV